MSKVRILVVDDEKAQCAALKDWFSATYDVTTAMSVAEARKLDLTKFDAAIVDYRMPGENGTALANDLAQHIPPNRVLLFTADSKAAEIREDHFTYVAKTVPIEYLETIVAKQLADDDTVKAAMWREGQGK